MQDETHSCVLFYDDSPESRRALAALRECEKSGLHCQYIDVTNPNIEFSEKQVFPWLLTPEGDFTGFTQITQFTNIRPEARLQALARSQVTSVRRH